MIKWLYPLLLHIVFIYATPAFSQKLSYPNTLLWRITGKQLKAPSYLFGTMHLQDKRLFNFGDSLYRGLESVEGFAVEIDFKEYLDSLFTNGIKEAQDEMLATQRIKLDKNKLDKSSDSIFKKLGIDRNNLTKKDLKKIRDYRVNKLLKQGEMKTIVDGYLFGLALRQNKWIGGIEDVSDQLNLMDELGSELTPEKVLAPESTMRKGLEQMIQAYLNQDLEGIDAMINGYGAEVRDVLLIRRNIKMARRMDSLTNIRTMFFAVGAAHLPGDSGIISLLRNRGFTVEPVYSSQKIAADQYAKKLQEVPWYKVQDENNLYTIEMPGNPSQFSEFGDAIKMKMFFDITTMTFYMTSQTIGKYSSSKEFAEVFKKMAENMGASTRHLSLKDVSRKDVHGREANFEKESIGFRVQLLQKNNSLFVLIAGSVNEKNLVSEDVDRFFSSFTANNVVPENKEWVQFSVPEKAFSIKLPGTPKRNPTINKQAEGSSWNFTSYDYVDNATGLYYLIQVRDLKEGLFLNGDSAYFHAYVTDTKQRMDTVLKVEPVVYKSFPAFYFDALYNKNIVYKTFHVARGNRVYLLLVGGSVKEIPEAETLFNSLVLEDYAATEWKTYSAAGFSTSAPAAFKKMEEEKEEDSKEVEREQFVAYAPNEAISYHVFKEAFPSLYWINNDSSFFAEKERAYLADTDSIIEKRIVYNGTLKSLDMIIQKPDNNNRQKVRLLVNGDSLYTLMAFIPSQYISNSKYQMFFDNFRVNAEKTPTIYNSKADQLLKALNAKDSALFAKAADVFNSIVFTKQDLPFLQKTLLEIYPDSILPYTIHSKSREAIKNIADTSTIRFVAENYATLKAEKERLKYQLLQVLAENKTTRSFNLIKNLVTSGAPAAGESYGLANALLDSAELVAAIYPELLPLCSDSIFSDAVARITWVLLDSGLLKRNQLIQHEKEFIKQAGLKYANAKLKNEEDGWSYYNWIKLLQRLNTEESNSLLKKLAASASLYVSYDAIEALLKNGQTISPIDLNKLAADKYFRIELFTLLKHLGYLKLFPTKFLTQKSMAESELFTIASDEYEPSKIEFVGERTALYMGVKAKFYLFKVQYNFDDGSKESYLSVAGPYSLTSKEISIDREATGLLSEEYNTRKIDQQLKSYLVGLERYAKEDNQ